jgi:hypothetical protein
MLPNAKLARGGASGMLVSTSSNHGVPATASGSLKPTVPSKLLMIISTVSSSPCRGMGGDQVDAGPGAPALMIKEIARCQQPRRQRGGRRHAAPVVASGIAKSTPIVGYGFRARAPRAPE